ncbi:MAG: helix-turn-helix domain-containing protein [Lentisphaerae bacterium]|nr:helix-turn-helix domain-containing protein [Lentisphaerota bacterium]
MSAHAETGKILQFKLERYTPYPVLCRFMRPFNFFERDSRHLHEDFYELVIVADGVTLDQGEEDMQVLQAGFFFIYAPGTIHNYGNMRNTKYFNVLVAKDVFENLLVKKDCMPGFEELFPCFGKRSEIFRLKGDGLKYIMDIAFAMQDEFNQQPPGWLEMIICQLQMLLIELWRWRRNDDIPEADDEKVPFRISRSISFMEKHLTHNISIRELARYVSMSESSYRHSFKDVSSYSPIHYLIRLRLKNALRLIFIGKSIAVAAKESGLRDSSYFGRMCRKYLGDSLQNILNISSSWQCTPEVKSERIIHEYDVYKSEYGSGEK